MVLKRHVHKQKLVAIRPNHESEIELGERKQQNGVDDHESTTLVRNTPSIAIPFLMLAVSLLKIAKEPLQKTKARFAPAKPTTKSLLS
ncbi:hypothetical protein CA13_51690 [Planctomycetes bacterium CA13]|uniref:Uncharacterized protein n=1 Tax=Novipirellula herctigrandis TaxID=2527986 RepID=A0A5C5Z8R3_9BACT|nr:hypothetical protein CA13_51690 [Planctomycetes bacterium CA13]